MKYEVIKSITGTVWYIYRGDQKLSGVALGMFPTAGECSDFANHLCNLLNADIDKPAKVEW
jgi:hypothetical protein